METLWGVCLKWLELWGCVTRLRPKGLNRTSGRDLCNPPWTIPAPACEMVQLHLK